MSPRRLPDMTMTLPSLLPVAGLCLALAACGRGERAPAEPEAPAVSAPAAAEAGQPAASATEPAPASAAEPHAPAEDEAEASSALPTPEPKRPTAVAAAPAPVAIPVSAGPPPAFARCQGCHKVEAGAGHGMGPNLAGVMGAAVGSRPGYAYSDAMAGFEGRWTPELMDAFLQDPRGVVPGTKMPPAAVRDAAARREIIDFLAKLD